MIRKRVIHPFSPEEFNTSDISQNLINWGLLYQKVMPLTFPFLILHSCWGKEDYYIHHCPSNAAVEIVLEGSMKYTLDEQVSIVRANEMILLPLGVPNRVEAGPDGFGRKAVFGIRGFLAEVILASFCLEGGRTYRLNDTGRILQMLSRLAVLYRKQDPALLNSVSAFAFEILLEIREQVHSRNARSSPVVQLMQMNLQNPCPIPEIARKLELSWEKLNAVFREQFQRSPQQYMTQLRMRTAEQLLRQTGQTIKQIAFQTGYHSLSRFATAFRKYHGMSPRDYRNAGRKITDLPD